MIEQLTNQWLYSYVRCVPRLLSLGAVYYNKRQTSSSSQDAANARRLPQHRGLRQEVNGGGDGVMPHYAPVVTPQHFAAGSSGPSVLAMERVEPSAPLEDE